MAAVVAEVDVVRRIREGHRGPPPAEQPPDVRPGRRVAASEGVIAEPPHVTRPCPRFARRRIESRLEVESFGALPALAAIEALQELRDLVLGEAGQRQIGGAR